MTRSAINCESRKLAERSALLRRRSPEVRFVEVGGEMEVYWPARTGREGRKRRWRSRSRCGSTISCTACGKVIQNLHERTVERLTLNPGGIA